MPEKVYSLLLTTPACAKEINHLVWILWKKSFRLEA